MTKTNPIDAAINKANEINANKAANPQTIDVYKQPGNGAVAHYAPPRLMTLDDLTVSGLEVDAFLKVKEDGIKVRTKKDDKTVESDLIEEMIVSIDTAEHKGMKACQAVRFGNSPTVYYKTYDGVKSATTGNLWLDDLAKAKQADPKARPYDSVDITMTLVEDAKTLKGGIGAVAGTTIGYSTPQSNGKNVIAFREALNASGLRGSVVDVKVTVEAKKNKDNQTWGVLKFEILGEHSDGE